jgi:DNA polymerase (family X)
MDLLVVALDRDRAQQQIREALADLGAVVDPATGPVVRGRLQNGVTVEVGAVTPEAFPAALVVTTGSAAHLEGLTARATARSMTLTTEGLVQDGRIVRCADEAAVYAALDLPWIAPELREGQGEIEAAEQGRLPVLVEPSDLLGCFHVHSTWSDGKNSLEEIARHAATIGLRYVGIADHSRSAAYAGGLSIDQLQEQGRAIDQINARGEGAHLLKGVESDILADGRLDYPDRMLAELDFVVGSIHSGLKMDQDTATARVLKALQNPRLSILGHPTGRLLLDREGYSLDWGPVLAAAARHCKVLEINAHPSRLDLDWRQVREALAAGVKLAVNPDAHDLAGFDHLPLGVAMARKGWATTADVVNTEPEPWKSFA